MRKAWPVAAALMLCAMAICMLGAGSASASGLTASVCEEVKAGTGEYTDSHCTKKGIGSYGTRVIEKGLTTEVVTASAEGVSPTFSFTIALQKEQIACESQRSTGGGIKNVTNAETGDMEVLGENIVLHYEGCTFHNFATGTNCEVQQSGAPKNGTLQINLKSHTTFSGTEHKVVLEPVVPSGTFLEVKLLKPCGEITLKMVGTVSGVVSAENPSLITFSGATGPPLKLGGIAVTYSDVETTAMAGTEEPVGLKTS